MQRALRAAFRVLSAVSPAIAARLAARVWFRIPPPRIGDTARAFIATGEPLDVTLNGRRVAAWRWGSGPTVVFVHGWGGFGAQYQTLIPAAVARGFGAIAFDAPSHGMSAPGRLGARYATLFEFSDVLRAIAHREPPLAGIVAHSGGCAAVAWALSKDPALGVHRLVFIAPFARALRYMKVFQRALGLSDATLRRFQQLTERQFDFEWKDLEVPDIADRMTTPPVLVVHDRDDPETAWQDGADIVAKWPRATMKTTTGLGHNRILRDPQVVEEIVEYLSAPA